MAESKTDGKSDWMGIKEVTPYAGFSHHIYTRQLLRAGKFDEPTPPVKKDFKGYSKWFIARESVDYYLAHRAKRTSGRRFLLKMDLGYEAAARAALDKAVGKDNYSLELSYKVKKEAKEKKAS